MFKKITKIKIKSEPDFKKAAQIMQSFGAKNILIKGGHFEAESRTKKTAKDFLFLENQLHIFESDWIETSATHGTGCTLAAAIAANLANEKNFVESVENAKKFVANAIRTAPNIGHGNSPINHSNAGFGV